MLLTRRLLFRSFSLVSKKRSENIYNLVAELIFFSFQLAFVERNICAKILKLLLQLICLKVSMNYSLFDLSVGLITLFDEKNDYYP